MSAQRQSENKDALETRLKQISSRLVERKAEF